MSSSIGVDRMVDVSNGRLFVQSRDGVSAARLIVVDDTGHPSPLEVPDEIAGRISSFIKQLRLRPKRTS